MLRKYTGATPFKPVFCRPGLDYSLSSHTGRNKEPVAGFASGQIVLVRLEVVCERLKQWRGNYEWNWRKIIWLQRLIIPWQVWEAVLSVATRWKFWFHYESCCLSFLHCSACFYTGTGTCCKEHKPVTSGGVWRRRWRSYARRPGTNQFHCHAWWFTYWAGSIVFTARCSSQAVTPAMPLQIVTRNRAY